VGSLRIGVDIGGTFTDFTVIDDQARTVVIDKTLTTPRAPEKAVLSGMERVARAMPALFTDAAEVIHATTLVTNVILERKGSRTALLATAGFRDILEMAREVRYELFDMFIELPKPIVPRALRVGIEERVLADGSVLTPLNEAQVRAAAAKFRQAGVQAVAISFLHSYRNATHEERAAQILRDEMPGVTISMSHEVHPEPKEYERTSTTAVDAYVKAITRDYLDRLSGELAKRGYRQRLFVMLSNGGTATADTAKRVPVQVVESGPAAGVEAATFFAKLLSIDRLLAFDMGGTTAKLCVVSHGRASRTREYEVDRVHRFKAGSGLPVSVPVYDLLELGSGGGSIARVNSLGLLQVGPQSAGSEPGPACYGRGGENPTVTDADLVLGYLSAGYFLGGDMKLDPDAAKRAIETRVARPAGLNLARAAAGMHDIVNETMASAARMYVTEKAMAPSELTLFASGGAGPVHAVELARKLGCPKVIVPPFSGVLSSLGLLTAPIAFERARSVRKALAEIDLARLEDSFRSLEREACALLPEPEKATIERTADVRYHGQDYSLEISFAEKPDSAGVRELWQSRFVAAYRELYGKVDDDNAIELASIRVYARQTAPAPIIPSPAAGKPAAAKGKREVYFSALQAYVSTPVYERDALTMGQVIAGPAIVEERISTTVIGPGDRLSVGAAGVLVIELAAQARDAGAKAEVRAAVKESA
jgi:N-methylhydantoinase A